jgi:DNA-binding transcriptional regulator YdaS (Cro superfamily)
MTPLEKSDLVRRVQTSERKLSKLYLGLVASGRKRAGETLAILLEDAMGEQGLLEDLRPDVPWHLVKPRPRKGARRG